MPRPLTLRRRLALDLAQILQRRRVAEHPLEQLFWECTLRCNLACRHCGSDCRQLSEVHDMPREDFGKVLDHVAAAMDPHKVMVVLTGGEPLMRRDLEQCGRMIHGKGFPWGMVTNGQALTPDRYRRLLESGLGAMTISLDGLGEDHDWMRGRPGSFERAAAAIKMVIASNAVNFDVVTCVNRRNISQLEAIRDFLISLGLKEWRLFTVFPSGRVASEPDLQLTSIELRRLMDFIRQTRKEGVIKASYGCEGFLGNYEGDVRGHFFSCEAGVSVASVLADGSISACPSIRADYHQGNIYKDNFIDVWNNGFSVMRDRSWMKTGLCQDCKFWKYCHGNGMHLRDGDGHLAFCHLERLEA